ncbi:hypothetical protein GIB67_000520 [Kingdonia uniflora]|uniref:RING-type domain-containing protein n=1 Tax=Kingdonia uniflora TaxID=39325 RepID=A0A7J7MIB9_9MAGN|nr:hypothetical protein GIB67_000520 [Kingdonia uniflora]
MGPQEPCWRTNTSFSPPVSRRWDHTFQSEGLVYGSHSGVQLYGSSLSSDSKGSSASIRDNHIPDHYVSDGAQSYFSSPSDSFQTQQWTLMPMNGVTMNDYVPGSLRGCMSGAVCLRSRGLCRTISRQVLRFRRCGLTADGSLGVVGGYGWLRRNNSEPVSRPLTFTPTMEGTSTVLYSGGSASSLSDGSEYEPSMANFPTNRSFSSRCSFKSKPIHPISFLDKPAAIDTQHFHPNYVGSIADLQSVSGVSEVDSTAQRRWSSDSSSIDFSDVSEHLDSESNVGRTQSTSLSSEGFKCGLCERFLCQRSPWSSRRIVRSDDMPVTGVLPCHHVFHAECLEKSVPKTQNHDPPCPLCATSECVELQPTVVVSRLRNGIPRLRVFGGEDGGPSKPWGSCGQVGDCVEGVLHASPRNSMMLLNKSRLKKHLSFKGNNTSKGISDMLKKSGPFPSQLYIGGSTDQDTGCSRDSPQLKGL